LIFAIPPLKIFGQHPREAFAHFLRTVHTISCLPVT
jgi:hypothetical protein